MIDRNRSFLVDLEEHSTLKSEPVQEAAERCFGSIQAGPVSDLMDNSIQKRKT
jgi:hypothetical protein